MKLVGPVERCVPQEQELVHNKLSHRRDFLSIGAVSDRRNRIKDKQTELKDWFELENSTSALISASLGSQEARVTSEIVLEKLDVLFILAERLQL